MLIGFLVFLEYTNTMNASSGFSLVETVVITAIVGIVSAMSFTAIPTIRAHQELVTDTETIRALLLDAKQRTLNQVRPAECLPGVVDDSARASCSDTGIAFDTNAGEIILFANSVSTGAGALKYDGPGRVRARSSRFVTPGASSTDHVISKAELKTTLGAGSSTSLLFVGVPPSVVLYSDGSPIGKGDDAVDMTLVASNGTERTIRIFAFGTIEVQ